MSRLGKKEIMIPMGVSVFWEGRKFSADGPKGHLEMAVRPEIEIKIEGEKIIVSAGNDRVGKTLWGTTHQLIVNMLKGVSEGWSKTLEVVGTGYRANLEGEKLVFALGFSHRVEVPLPEGITFQAAENKVTVTGADKALVGKIAAEIRALRPPDAYKGKGIRYQGEYVRLKPGKAAKTGPSAGKK